MVHGIHKPSANGEYRFVCKNKGCARKGRVQRRGHHWFWRMVFTFDGDPRTRIRHCPNCGWPGRPPPSGGSVVFVAAEDIKAGDFVGMNGPALTVRQPPPPPPPNEATTRGYGYPPPPKKMEGGLTKREWASLRWAMRWTHPKLRVRVRHLIGPPT